MPKESGVWDILGKVINRFGFVGYILFFILLIAYLFGNEGHHTWIADFVLYQSDTQLEKYIYTGILALLGINYVINSVREKNAKERTDDAILDQNKRLTERPQELDLNEDRPEPQTGNSPPDHEQTTN